MTGRFIGKPRGVRVRRRVSSGGCQRVQSSVGLFSPKPSPHKASGVPAPICPALSKPIRSSGLKVSTPVGSWGTFEEREGNGVGLRSLSRPGSLLLSDELVHSPCFVQSAESA